MLWGLARLDAYWGLKSFSGGTSVDCVTSASTKNTNESTPSRYGQHLANSLASPSGLRLDASGFSHCRHRPKTLFVLQPTDDYHGWYCNPARTLLTNLRWFNVGISTDGEDLSQKRFQCRALKITNLSNRLTNYFAGCCANFAHGS